MKILIIEDNEDILSFLKSSLKAKGFIIDGTDNGRIGCSMALTNEYNLIILDLNLPEKDGNTICQEIREYGKTTPIIMLSVNIDIKSKIDLLESGADDYLTKPFSFEELLARIKALLKRSPQIEDDILKSNNLILNKNKQKVTKNDKEIYLTVKEFQLLEYLLRHKGEIVSKTSILENIWDSEVNLFSNAIETHILNLRKKISKDNPHEFIKTMSGRGYKIE